MMFEPIIIPENQVQVVSFGKKGYELLAKFKRKSIYQDNKDFYDLTSSTNTNEFYAPFIIFIYSNENNDIRQDFIEKLKDNASDVQSLIVCFLDNPDENMLLEVNKYASTILIKDNKNRDNFEEVIFNLLYFFYSAIEENDHWYIWYEIDKIFLKPTHQPKQFYGISLKAMNVDDFEKKFIKFFTN